MDSALLAGDTIYGLIFLAAGVLAALQSQRDLAIAKSLVIIGGSIMAVRWTAWALLTELHWPIRGLVGALIGASLFVFLPAAIHWISERQTKTELSAPSTIDIRFEPKPRYEIAEISFQGRIKSVVKIGLKATGQSFSNCKVFINKIAPQINITGGLPMPLVGSDFILRHDDPEYLFEIASHWDNIDEFRFNSPGGHWKESMNYIDDKIPLTVEIQITANKMDGSEFQKTALFELSTDDSRKLHMKRIQ